MFFVAVGLWIGVAVLLVMAWRRPGDEMKSGLTIAGRHLRTMAPRVTLALLMAGFLAELLPGELLGTWLGTDSGWTGILTGSVIGILVPAGGVIAFPLALAMLKVGVGVPPLVAFITAWAVFAIHRMAAFELPLLGPRFLVLRLVSSFMLPPLAGFLTTLVMAATAM